MEEKLYWYKGKVERVIDGDTLVVFCDVGFNTYYRLRCRLARVNAPEITRVEGVAARDFIKEKVEGKEVIIRSTFWDKYGRALAEIYFLEAGSWKNLSDTLVNSNLAEYYKK